jgi:hypothetical protein
VVLAPGEALTFRCSDIGKFRLEGHRQESGRSINITEYIFCYLQNKRGDIVCVDDTGCSRGSFACVAGKTAVR